MIRGTTAQFKFKLPCTKDELCWATVEFWQPGNSGTPAAPLPIIKKLNGDDAPMINCPLPGDAKELCVSLLPDETMRFSDKIKAKVQLRAQRQDGTVFANLEKLITVYPASDDILSEYIPMPTPDGSGVIVLDGQSIITEKDGDKQ